MSNQYTCLAIIPRNMTAVFKVFRWRISLNRFYFDALYFNDAVLKACWALPKLCTMRSVSLHEGTCCTPQHLHVCAKVVILPLLDAPAKCRLSVYYTHLCRCNMSRVSLQHMTRALMSSHLKTAGKHCHQQAQLLNKVLNT